MIEIWEYSEKANDERVSGIVKAIAVELTGQISMGGLSEGHSRSIKIEKGRQEGYLKYPCKKSC